MMRRITRRLRAIRHRRELNWALGELRLENLDELEAWAAEPQSEAVRRFIATRERIMIRRNPAKLIEEALVRERLWRVIDAVVGYRQKSVRVAAIIFTILACCYTPAKADEIWPYPYSDKGTPPRPGDSALIADVMVCVAGGDLLGYDMSGRMILDEDLYVKVKRMGEAAIAAGDMHALRNSLLWSGAKGCTKVRAVAAVKIYDSSSTPKGIVRFQFLGETETNHVFVPPDRFVDVPKPLAERNIYEVDEDAICSPWPCQWWRPGK
jgi:hypothetical protein